ncbi:hypothetical protein GCM10022243_48520 [Saccharothrix violaceirubra]|uniref:Uncharacterized protein n=1 Tax=Saccharothrix violaceirubra TaxID=413306 RepID=A0A7W7SZQ4_9PSEU|nr:hypothetical protein [Saccharothrix violaceirubra]MBB4963805.1 hypothetical protein [Saccharothrix violaceirubra]
MPRFLATVLRTCFVVVVVFNVVGAVGNLVTGQPTTGYIANLAFALSVYNLARPGDPHWARA